MSVEVRQGSRYWYGRWQVNGLRFSKNLKVVVKGRPGSDEFDKSRLAAEEALVILRQEANSPSRSEDLIRRIHEVKFGSKIGIVPLNDLEQEWISLPRKRPITESRARYGRRVLKDFVDFIRAKHSKVKELAAVTPAMAQQYMAKLEKAGSSGRTYNEALTLLRGTFERLRIKAGILGNPFREGLVSKDENSIHRRPFTIDELEHLWGIAAKMDADIHDLLVLGACTALRRGDAACLKWQDVDYPGNRIRIQTQKTGAKVSIPIFPRLRQVLEGRKRIGEYVFPELAAIYRNQSWELNKRLNRVFTAAGFFQMDPENDGKPLSPVINVDIPDAENMRRTVLAKIDALGPDDVAPRIKATMREVFDLYSSGATLPDIVKQLDSSKGSISLYLSRIEKVAGHPIIRREIKQVKEAQAIAAAGPGEAAPERRDGKGKIRVNNRGFHALRATFTTQALAAGVPVEVVKLITGHTLTETVLKHYFNPDEQTVFAKMQRAMPQLLTQHTGKTLRDELIEEIKKAKLPKKNLTALLALAERIPT